MSLDERLGIPHDELKNGRPIELSTRFQRPSQEITLPVTFF